MANTQTTMIFFNGKNMTMSEAFQNISNECYKKALRLTKNPYQAEDIAQDASINIYLDITKNNTSYTSSKVAGVTFRQWVQHKRKSHDFIESVADICCFDNQTENNIEEKIHENHLLSILQSIAQTRNDQKLTPYINDATYEQIIAVMNDTSITTGNTRICRAKHNVLEQYFNP